MRKFLAITLSLLMLLASATVLADEVDDELERLEAQAAEAYGAGEYQNAINLMVRANQLRPHPNYLLNIAVSYSKLEDCDNAVLFANLALESKNPLPTEARPAAESVLSECAPAPEIDPPDGNNGANNGANNGTGSTPKDEGGLTGLQWTGIGVFSAGVVVLGADLLFLDAPLVDDQDAFKQRVANDPVYANSDAAAAEKKKLKDRETPVLVGIVVSSLMMATGTFLFVMDFFVEEPVATGVGSLRVAPLVSGDTAGLQLGFEW